MNLLTRAQYWLARTALKASALSFVPTWTRTSFLEPSFDRLAREGYNLNAAVHICISRLSRAYQDPPIRVLARDGEPLPDHPLQALLDRPNPDMGWEQLAGYIETYKAIGGQAYLRKIRSGAGRVVALYPFHAGHVSVVPGQYEWISHYEYDPGDHDTERVDKKDMIQLQWPSPDPAQPWMAVPPLRAIAREVDTDAEATRYMFALLANDAAPRTILQVPGALNDTTFQRLQAQFTQRHGGDNRGNVAVVEGGATISRFSLDMQELGFDALRKVPEARIAAVFGIPAEYSGLNVGLEHSTYNNQTEARRAFYEDTITQHCGLDAGVLTRSLGDDFGGNIRVEFDFSKVAALQENEDARYTRVIAGWDKGLLGQKEARKLLGLAEDLAPDDAYKTAPALPGFGNMIDVTPQGLPAGPGEAIGANAGKGSDRRPAARKAAPSETVERRMERALVTYLTAQYTRAAEAVAAGG